VTDHPGHRAYTLKATGLSLVLALCLIAFNFILDPYDIYPGVGSLSPGEKSELISRLRMHKPYAMQVRRAEHIVLGSSRGASLPPDVMGKRAYNASLPGILMREMRGMVEHAHAIQPLKSVVLALDYYMFREKNTGLTREGFAEARLLKSKPSLLYTFAHRQQQVRDHWNSLLSVDATLESSGLISGRTVTGVAYLEDGTWVGTPTKSPRWFYSFVNKKRMREFLADSGSLDFREFEQLLEFLQDRDIDTTLLISPFHGSVMNSVRLAGGWKKYLAWQQSVMETAGHYGAGMRVTGIEHNAEIILQPIDSKELFFTDGMHYSSEAGEIIMRCIVGEQCNDELTQQVLNSSNITTYLETVDSLMKAYPMQNPQDFKALQRWLADILKAPG